MDARFFQPMLLLRKESLPDSSDWFYEIKLDGFRMGVLVARRGKTREVMIMSRNGTDYTAAFPEIVEAAMELPMRAAVLDGEVVVLDERGRSSFQLLQQLGSSRRGLQGFRTDRRPADVRREREVDSAT